MLAVFAILFLIDKGVFNDFKLNIFLKFPGQFLFPVLYFAITKVIYILFWISMPLIIIFVFSYYKNRVDTTKNYKRLILLIFSALLILLVTFCTPYIDSLEMSLLIQLFTLCFRLAVSILNSYTVIFNILFNVDTLTSRKLRTLIPINLVALFIYFYRMYYLI